MQHDAPPHNGRSYLTPNDQLPTTNELPIPNSQNATVENCCWKLEVGSSLVVGRWELGVDMMPLSGRPSMKRQIVLGILLAAGALTMSVNALQQPAAPAAGQAPRV